jgi:hypothetical protein
MPGTSELLFSFVGEKGIYWLLKESVEDAALFMSATAEDLPEYPARPKRAREKQAGTRHGCLSESCTGRNPVLSPQWCQTFRGTGF